MRRGDLTEGFLRYRSMLLAKGMDIRIFYGVAARTLFNRMHHMHFVVNGDIFLTLLINPFTAR